MDEPTAALSGHEVERLFARRRARCASAAPRCCSSPTGSTRSSRSATRVTVMRDGAVVHDAPIAEHDAPTSWCGGWSAASSPQLFPKQDGRDRRARAARSSGSRARACSSTSRFEVRARRDRRARRPRRRRAQRGRARDLRHRPRRRRPRRGRRAAAAGRHARSPRCAPGIALVPEDRRQQGLVMDLSIARNVDAHAAAGARRGSG